MGAATQLELALQPRRTPARQQLVIERLRAVLTRQGINWRYRANTGGSVLLRPLLGVRCGYQPMCGFYGCGSIMFERTDYFDRPPLSHEDRIEHQGYLVARRQAVNALWGPAC